MQFAANDCQSAMTWGKVQNFILEKKPFTSMNMTPLCYLMRHQCVVHCLKL